MIRLMRVYEFYTLKAICSAFHYGAKSVKIGTLKAECRKERLIACAKQFPKYSTCGPLLLDVEEHAEYNIATGHRTSHYDH